MVAKKQHYLVLTVKIAALLGKRVFQTSLEINANIALLST